MIETNREEQHFSLFLSYIMQELYSELKWCLYQLVSALTGICIRKSCYGSSFYELIVYLNNEYYFCIIFRECFIDFLQTDLDCYIAN